MFSFAKIPKETDNREITYISPCICKSPLFEFVDEGDDDTVIFYKDELEAQRSKIYLLKLLCLSDDRLPNKIQIAKLVQFLYLSEFSVTKTYYRLLRHFKYMEEYPELYLNRDDILDHIITNIWPAIVCTTIPVLTPAGNRVYYLGGNPHKESPKVDPVDLLRCFLACLESSLLWCGITKESIIIIDTRFLHPIDGPLDKIKFQQFIYRYMPLFKDGLQINVKKVFFIFSLKNDDMWKAYSSILNYDLGDMLVFVSNPEEYFCKMQKYVPSKLLPAFCYGRLEEDLMDLNENIIDLAIYSAPYIIKEEEIRLTLPNEKVYRIYQTRIPPPRLPVLKLLEKQKKQKANCSYFREKYIHAVPDLDSNIYK